MKAPKIIGIILGLLIVIVLAGVLWFNMTYPKDGPVQNIRVDASPERIERGRYLANHVMVCMDCHSERNWQYYAAPLKSGTLGMGGELFDEDFGKVYSANITPAGIGKWTDGQLMHAIVSGVNPDGKVLVPVMPYPDYNHMDEDDLISIMAYIRTIEPIENEVPGATIKFPFSALFQTAPAPYDPKPKPDTTDMVAYGKYLTTMAGCFTCHTPMEKGAPILDMAFAGGMEFKTPIGLIRSVNITPDKDTGIGVWDEDDFVMRFQGYADSTMQTMPVMEGQFNTVMPWTMFSGMQEGDLRAIYRYLRTVKPINHVVEKFTEPAP